MLAILGKLETQRAITRSFSYEQFGPKQFNLERKRHYSRPRKKRGGDRDTAVSAQVKITTS
jgi:hypothetical protein